MKLDRRGVTVVSFSSKGKIKIKNKAKNQGREERERERKEREGKNRTFSATSLNEEGHITRTANGP